ncbi:MAG: lysophospholipid acyltransferase family protein [Blastocatellia bacterium]
MAKKSKGQIWLEYLAARLVLGFLGMLPRKSAIMLAIGITRLGFYFLRGLRKVALLNLEIALPESSDLERRSIAKGCFENLGRVLGEVSQFHKATPKSLAKLIDFELDAESASLEKKVRAARRGILITTGHLGNWELLVFAYAALREPISYLARPIDNSLIEEMTHRYRTRFGNRPIDKTNSAMLAISILRDGGTLGVLSDVNAHPKEGVFVSFFGVQACTPSGAAMIAIRADAIIYPAFCVWDKEAACYRFVGGAVIEPANTGDRKKDIVETTAAYTTEIEKIIRKYPDQWMWIHKRWKTRPPGERQLYD